MNERMTTGKLSLISSVLRMTASWEHGLNSIPPHAGVWCIQYVYIHVQVQHEQEVRRLHIKNNFTLHFDLFCFVLSDTQLTIRLTGMVQVDVVYFSCFSAAFCSRLIETRR